jgi:hypothetical protein
VAEKIIGGLNPVDYNNSLPIPTGYIRNSVSVTVVLDCGPIGRGGSVVAAVLAGCDADLAPENLREVAGTGVTDFQADFNYAFLRLAQQLASLIHAQADEKL